MCQGAGCFRFLNESWSMKCQGLRHVLGSQSTEEADAGALQSVDAEKVLGRSWVGVEGPRAAVVTYRHSLTKKSQYLVL